MQLFREAMLSEGFQEIHTPKLIAGASEGGASVFKLNYIGQPGCLAQSPQFYKQMAVCSDMSRVFEIGPVFRSEPALHTLQRGTYILGTGIAVSMLWHIAAFKKQWGEAERT